MATITSDGNGTQTLTGGGSEDDLHAAVTDADVYQYMFDLGNMSDGDELQIRIDMKVLTGGSLIDFIELTFKNAQAVPVIYTPPLPSLYSIQAHATEISSSGFGLPWNRIEYAVPLVSDGNGTKTLTGGASEDALHTAVTDADVYQYLFDLSNMSDADELRLRVATKTLTGSTAANIMDKVYSDSQGAPGIITPPIPSLYSIQALANEISSSGFNLPWNRIAFSAS